MFPARSARRETLRLLLGFDQTSRIHVRRHAGATTKLRGSRSVFCLVKPFHSHANYLNHSAYIQRSSAVAESAKIRRPQIQIGLPSIECSASKNYISQDSSPSTTPPSSSFLQPSRP